MAFILSGNGLELSKESKNMNKENESYVCMKNDYSDGRGPVLLVHVFLISHISHSLLIKLKKKSEILSFKSLFFWNTKCEFLKSILSGKKNYESDSLDMVQYSMSYVAIW